MPREAGLFEAADGNIVDAYLILRKEGKNIPPNWIERARCSHKSSEKDLGRALKAGRLDAVTMMWDWHTAFRKECFYHGLRALMEMERKGRTKF